jgi:hypothetical protein
LEELEIRILKRVELTKEEYEGQLARMRETLLKFSKSLRKLLDWKGAHVKEYTKVKKKNDFLFRERQK